MKSHTVLFLLFLVIASGSLDPCWAGSGLPSQPAPIIESLPGYLPPEDLPDSLALLPPPPEQGTAALALDIEVNERSLHLRETLRWELAIEDANLNFPDAATTFSCALNARITEHDTPHLYMLLRRTLTDASKSTQKAKDYYHRTRPFVVNKKHSCTPDAENELAANGSYPSGHTTIGWAWALILSEIAPEQADAILSRGRAFGESRVVCNVHWQSDVNEARVMGAAVVARLHTDPVFRAELKAAKADLAAVRVKGLKPLRDCATEAAEMATWGK